MSVEEARKPQMNLRTACAVGGRPGALWVSPDGSRLFVFDQDRPEVSVIGVSGWQLLERVPCGPAPDERPAFLAGFGESIFLGGHPGMIHHFSAASHRADGAIPCVGDACDLGVIRELRQGVLVTAGGCGGHVELLGLSPLRTLSRLDLPLPPRRRSLALLPVQGRGAVVMSDPAREAEAIAIFDFREGTAPAVIRMRPGIRSLAFEASGRFLYAACHDDSTVAVIDVSARRVVDQILMAGQPYQIACDPVGRRLWVLCEKLGHVACIDPTDQSILRRTQLAGLTAGTERIAFSPEGHLAIVPELAGGCLSLLESGAWGAENGELDDCLELGREIGEVVWSPLGEEVYVAAQNPGAVLRLAVDRGDRELKDTDLYLMQQLLHDEETVRPQIPLFPP